MVSIGIDLGTTNSCVAVWRQDRAEVIANDLGHRITPSCVAFDDTERFIGTPAVLQSIRNPRNTVYEVKRLMGRRFDDPKVQADMTQWPFRVVDVGGAPRLQVQYRNELKTLTPEEISAMLLLKMKETAEKFLDTPVHDAVITVPAYFNDAQRQATLDAGEIAGLNVLRIINEPTAVALAYGLNTDVEGMRHILIYDLGGGTFDVSIVRLEPGPQISVLASTGNSHLGGSDFGNKLFDHLANKFKAKHGKNILDHPRAFSKLKIEIETVKTMLSTNLKYEIYIDNLMDGIDLNESVSRAQFEDICKDLFKSTLIHVQTALDDANMTKADIDEVVLAGGSTRIPMIKKLLQDFFVGKSLKETISPDEAVAYGAAVQAAILSGDAKIKFEDLSCSDVTAMSFGTEVFGGRMSVVVPRNTPIPCSVSQMYCTAKDNQSSMVVNVFQGEGLMVKDNTFLGTFTLTGIPRAPAGVGSTLDTFKVDENGVLTISSVERVTGTSTSIVIEIRKSLPRGDISEMRRDIERMDQGDEDEYCHETLTNL